MARRGMVRHLIDFFPVFCFAFIHFFFLFFRDFPNHWIFIALDLQIQRLTFKWSKQKKKKIKSSFSPLACSSSSSLYFSFDFLFSRFLRIFTSSSFLALFFCRWTSSFCSNQIISQSSAHHLSPIKIWGFIFELW